MTYPTNGRLAAGYLKALAATRDRLSAAEYVKAAVGGLSTGNTPELVSQVGLDFMAFVRPKTLLGRLKHVRRISFITRALVQSNGALGYWVSETKNVPMLVPTLSPVPALPARKVAAMSVISEELVRASDAEDIVLNDLAAAAIAMMDTSFVNPTFAAVSDERPASITNGQPTAAASGTDAAAVRADLKTLIGLYTGDLSSGVLMMSPRTALRISLLLPGDVNVRFDIEAGTGIMFGLPVLLSTAVPATVIALVDGACVQVAGFGEVELRSTREGMVLMDSAPNSGNPPRVSLFQTNSVALMAIMPVNWQLLRSGAAATLTGVAY